MNSEMAKRQSGGVKCRDNEIVFPFPSGTLPQGLAAQGAGSTAPGLASSPGSWSVQMERGRALVVLRSLLWPGLTFYHAPRTKNCGYIYVGTGEKNIDLPFML